MYDLLTINEILGNDNIRLTLVQYCKYLAGKYEETNEGKYMIKYAALYRLLYHSLSDEKKVEFFTSFATSLNIFPIYRIDPNRILLEPF